MLTVLSRPPQLRPSHGTYCLWCIGMITESTVNGAGLPVSIYRPALDSSFENTLTPHGSARWALRFLSGVVPVVMCCTMKPAYASIASLRKRWSGIIIG